MNSAQAALRPGALGEDALRELVNIGSGSAIRALSELLGGTKVMMTVPCYERGVRLNTLVQGDPPGVMVRLAFGESAPYTFFLLFEQEAAGEWAGRILGGQPPAGLGELELSALLELGNIMACAFLDAVVRLTGASLLPGPPVARAGGLAALLRGELLGSARRVAISTHFETSDGRVCGQLLLLTTDEGAGLWAERLGVGRGA